jgi:hypothetical protein
MNWKTIVFAAMFAVITGPLRAASAALIIGNGSLNDASTSGAGFSFGSHSGYGMFFSMGATSATLKSASVLMRNSGSGAISKDFNARLYNFADIGTPNATPLMSQSFTASLSPGTSQWFSVNYGSAYNLAASGNYFFAVEEVTNENQPNISWAEPSSSLNGYTSAFGVFIQTGTLYERLDTGNTYAGFTDGTHFGFQLSTEAVPEPSSLVLMGMGLASVAAAAKRARRKKGSDSNATAESVVV